MPQVTNPRLTVVSMTDSAARLKVECSVRFTSREIAANAVFDCDLYLQNEDGTGDIDVRRRKLGSRWVKAQSDPEEISLTTNVSRDFLNEDFEIVGGFGDKTDEWHVEIVLQPYIPSGVTRFRTNTIRREFQP